MTTLKLGREGVLIRKGHTGGFQGAGNLLLLALGFGSMGTHFIIIFNLIAIFYAFLCICVIFQTQ